MSVLLSRWLAASNTTVNAVAVLSILTIAFVDWQVKPNISLGFLYIIPLLAAAAYISRLRIALLAAACSLLREAFSPAPLDDGFATRFLMVFLAFLGGSLFVSELARNRQRALEHSLELQNEVHLREEAEKQLRVLVESNPAAILTVNDQGRILTANEAAHRLLLPRGGRLLCGDPVSVYLPDLDKVRRTNGQQLHFRTMLECTGQARDGAKFLAEVWFSTYETRSGTQLAAIVLDSSEQFRDREDLGLSSLMTNSKILLGAALHEVRNLCAAAGVAHANLSRLSELAGNEDFRALGSLVKGLGHLAKAELRASRLHDLEETDLHSVFNELQIVIEPSFAEVSARLRWEIPDDLPRVQCQHQSLLQVFLNLAHNSLRAIEQCQERELTIAASRDQGKVVSRFQDTGIGVKSPELLFRPFQADADAAGLGLYVSRAIMRSFSGDVSYEPRETGSCFIVEMPSLPERSRGDRNV